MKWRPEGGQEPNFSPFFGSLGIDFQRQIAIFLVSAAPIATDIPCPKEPDAILIPGKPSCVVG